MCFVELEFGPFFGVSEKANFCKFVVVRLRDCFCLLRFLTNRSFLMCLGWCLSHWGRLLLLERGFQWLVLFRIFVKVSLSDGREQLVSSNHCLVALSIFVPKWGRRLEAIIVFLSYFFFDHGLFWLRSGCDHGLRLGKWLCWASFAALCNCFLSDHSVITHVHGLLITPRIFSVFFLFVFLAQVVSIGPRSLFISLHFVCVIMAIWQSVDRLLHEFGLKLPPGYVRVHILHECAWRCSLHFVGWYRLPLAVQQLQVWKQPFDFEICSGEFFRGETVVFYVETDGFLRDVLLVDVELRGKESGNSFYGCVYHRSHFLFNNNKHALFILLKSYLKILLSMNFQQQ